MSCGSTALHLLLQQYKDIFMSEIKEPYYYVARAIKYGVENNKGDILEMELKLKEFLEKGKYRTTEKYYSLFEGKAGYKYLGESSHYIYNPDTAYCIKSDCPSAKILITLRNPIDRFVSEYLYYLRDGKLNLSIDEFIESNIELLADEKSRLDKGLYFKAIKHWKSVFGDENVKVLIFDDIKNNLEDTLKEIFDWLCIKKDVKMVNVSPQKTGVIKYKKIFQTINKSHFVKSIFKFIIPKKKRGNLRSVFYDFFIQKNTVKISSRNRQFLLKYYQDDVKNVSKFLNRDLSDWLSIENK